MANVTERYQIEFTEKGARVVSQNINQIGASSSAAQPKVAGLSRTISGLAGLAVLNRLQDMTDQYTSMTNRVSLVTDPTQNVVDVMDRLRGIANETRTSLEATETIYTRASFAAQNLGRSQEDVIRLTKALNQITIISGARTQEATNALIQFSQGLRSNRLGGDELRAVLEQLPIVTDIISRSLGISSKELKKFAETGKITADVIFDSILANTDKIDKAFGKTQTTIGQAFTILNNELTFAIGEFGQASGAAEAFAKSITVIAEAIGPAVSGLSNLLVTAALLSRQGFDFFKDLLTPEGFEDKMKRLEIRLRTIGQIIKDTFQQEKRVVPGAGGFLGPDAPGGADKARADALAELLLNLERELALAGENARVKENTLRLEKIAADFKKKGIELTSAENDQIAQMLSRIDRAEIGRALRDQLVPDMVELNVQTKELNKLLGEGAISATTFAAEMRKIALAKEPLTETEEFIRSNFLKLGDLFVDVFADGEKAVARFAETALRELGRIAFFEALFSAFPGLESSRIGGRRQFGGPVEAGRSYMVGERGPEVVTFPQAGRVDPVPKISGGAVTIVNLTDPDQVRAYIESGKADRVIINRLAANPDLVRQATKG